MIVPKMRHENERVNLLALAVSQKTYFSPSTPSLPDASPIIHASFLLAAGGMCQELRPEVPPGVGKISLPQRTHQNALRKSQF